MFTNNKYSSESDRVEGCYISEGEVLLLAGMILAPLSLCIIGIIIVCVITI